VTLRADIRAAADEFRLHVAFEVTGGITALFGPSGAGKTLTLRHIAGLERPMSGRITLGDRVLFDAAAGIDLSPRRRRVGLVFQEYALFPHLSVGANVAYGLSGLGRGARLRRVSELLDLVGLSGYGARGPRALSGGERQRVALARALAAEPELLLLDEPFAALDFRIRGELRTAFLDIRRRAGVPVVLVTHAVEDVRALADSVVLMSGGGVVASGPTGDVFSRPPSAEAAALLGVPGENRLHPER